MSFRRLRNGYWKYFCILFIMEETELKDIIVEEKFAVMEETVGIEVCLGSMERPTMER